MQFSKIISALAVFAAAQAVAIPYAQTVSRCYCCI